MRPLVPKAPPDDLAPASSDEFDAESCANPKARPRALNSARAQRPHAKTHSSR